MFISEEMLLRTIDMMKSSSTSTISLKELVSYFTTIGINTTITTTTTTITTTTTATTTTTTATTTTTTTPFNDLH